MNKFCIENYVFRITVNFSYTRFKVSISSRNRSNNNYRRACILSEKKNGRHNWQLSRMHSKRHNTRRKHTPTRHFNSTTIICPHNVSSVVLNKNTFIRVVFVAARNV